MEIIDPVHLLNKTVKISDECPEELRFTVRLLKADMMWNDVDLIRDKESLIKSIFEMTNSPSWPPNHSWGKKVSKEKVEEIFIKARDWIMCKEEL